MRILKSMLPVFLAALIFVSLSSLSFAAAPDRIMGSLNSGQTVRLSGQVHRNAVPQYDQGPVDPAMQLGTLTLMTTPTAAQQRAMSLLLAQQQDHTSRNYHKWISPEQFADQFGLSQHDVQTMTAWLQSKGFTMIRAARGRNWVSFTGTAAQAESAFGTQIHNFNANGELHYANTADPVLPAALGGVVTYVRGLHNFLPRPMHAKRSAGLNSDYFNSTYGNIIAPGDIATIYDVNALYNLGIDGTGQKLAVMGQGDVYLSDINDFRSAFGLSALNCTTNTSGEITACDDPHFQYVLDGTDPGLGAQGNLTEADLDLEWSGAVARGAQIIYVNSTDTFNSFGYAIDNDLAPVISLSYGNCEADIPSLGSVYEPQLQQANMEGITFMNSSGDTGAAECDINQDLASGQAIHGLAVSYPASSPEVTGVGGTAIVLGDDAGAPYWSTTTTNPTDGGTALSYVPEQGWNDDAEFQQLCATAVAGSPLGLFCSQGGSPAQSPWQAIGTAANAQFDIGISQSGGGVSNCATQSSGVCVAGFSKPSWQNLVPAQTTRMSPDVSFLASPNFADYIYCTQLTELNDTGTGSVCANGIEAALAQNHPPLVGGTSASAPVFAGMVTLLNQYLAGTSAAGLGNINPMLYSLAETPANAAFHQVTTGNNMVYCSPGTPAGQPVAIQCPSTGVMGYDASTADATTGYNLVTGLGSVDLDKLAVAWSATRALTSVTISPLVTQINFGQSVTFTATVTTTTSVVGNVSFFNNSSTTPLSTVNLTGTTAAFTTTTLPAGTDNITATYNGDGVNMPSTTATAATVTVTQANFTVGTAPGTVSVVAGQTSSPVTVTITPTDGFNSAVTFSCSGAVPGATCAFNPPTVTPDGINPITTSMTIISAANTTNGTANVTVNATGSGLTNTAVVSLTVTATNESFTLTPQNGTYQVAQGSSVTATITVGNVNGFNLPITYSCTDPASGSICTGPSGPTSATSVSFMVTTTAPSSRSRVSASGGSTRMFYAALLPGLLGILFTAGSRKSSRGKRRGMRLLGMICVLGFSTLWLGSCGGSSSSMSSPGTPINTYTFIVNATTGGGSPVTGSTTFMVMVTK